MNNKIISHNTKLILYYCFLTHTHTHAHSLSLAVLLVTLKVCRSSRLSDNFSSESVNKISVTCTSAYYHKLVPPTLYFCGLSHSLSLLHPLPPNLLLSHLHYAMMKHL